MEGGIKSYAYVDDTNVEIDEFGLLRRPYIRNSTRVAAEKNAKVANGIFLDPNTGKPIPGGKRRGYSRAKQEYDLGH